MNFKRKFLLLVLPLCAIACQVVGGFQTETMPPDSEKAVEDGTATPIPTIHEEVAISNDVEYELVDESPAPEKFTLVRVASSSGKLEDILRIEAQKAVALGQDPYVEFFADWCPPCNAIKENISDERMIEAYEGTYIIQLDLDEWEQKLSGTGFYVIGIPAFYEIDEEGKPTGRMITGAAWGEDIPENIAPPLKAFFRGENE